MSGISESVMEQPCLDWSRGVCRGTLKSLE